MNPILKALNTFSPIPVQSNLTPDSAKKQVMEIVDSMNKQQKASLNNMLPVIKRIASQKGVDISSLTELQARMRP